MKPELKALWKAVLDAPVGDPGGLHWRGDELWCGPIMFGHVTGNYSGPYLGHPLVFRALDALWSANTVTYKNKNEARAALEAAVRKQIEAFFKDQA